MTTARPRLFVLSSLLAACAAQAQVPLDTTIALPAVTVTATRSATPVATAPVRVTVLDVQDAAGAGASTVADLLGERAGLFVRRYGAGGLASLSLRGTGASQTLVLLDGHRLGDPMLGQLDLSLLPTFLFSKAEVVHGAASPLYGADALGGVVHLHTVRPGAAPDLRLALAAGAYGTWSGEALAAGARGRWHGLAAAGYTQSEGDYPYRNEALFPPRDVRREGADLRRGSLYTTLRYEGSTRRSYVSAWMGAAARGVPAVGAPAQGERQGDGHLRLWVGHEARLAWGQLQVGGAVQRTRLRYLNPTLGVDDTGRTLVASAQANVRTLLSPRWLAVGGLAASYGQARHPSLGAEAREVSLGFFASGTGSYGRLLLYPALRADLYGGADLGTQLALSPQLGVNAHLAPGLRLKVRAASAFRRPTFNDRFWQPGGNPGLQPERGWTADAGLLATSGGRQGEVTAFASRTHDQIVWAPVPGHDYWAPSNRSRVRTHGLEASGRLHQNVRRARVSVGAVYTLVDARDRSDPASAAYGQPLRYVPRHQLKAFADLRRGPFQMGLSVRATGRRHITADASEALAAFTVADVYAGLEQRLGGVQAGLSLYFENALDHTYQVVAGQPMPPRHARLRLTLRTASRP